MSKFKIIIVVSILMILLNSCKDTKEAIVIEQKRVDYPVVLRMSSKYKKIFRINLPLKLKIKNNSLRRRSFTSIDYEYEPFRRRFGITLFREQEKKLKRISNTKFKHIYPYEEEEFVFKTWHRLDSSQTFQKYFSEDIKKMIALKQDTLLVGNLDDFKCNYKEIFDQIVSGDSIRIDFRNPRAGDNLNGRITVPVEW
ncbi:hypothetical protein BZG01_15215 [Labilibaculum manganireducens]|uniref:Uncharacterized protein n=1 Tax=Labilibaculum manganireducens TaxID=1940525 RepID=A0A2N3I1B5_9BACT|nr:hypothetical protein [Labilibaculum manganireducens]PKQ64043.1 hypothetical protein BZG01_15215 [Labilibaculum manganireducens]